MHVLETCFPYKMVISGGQKYLRKATLEEIEGRKVDRIVVKRDLYWAAESDRDPPVEWVIVDPRKYFGLFDTRECFDI